jgi:hypothetical protein
LNNNVVVEPISYQRLQTTNLFNAILAEIQLGQIHQRCQPATNVNDAIRLHTTGQLGPLANDAPYTTHAPPTHHMHRLLLHILGSSIF